MARGAAKPPANHLRAWRELAGLTQAQLAEKVQTKAGVISELESGKQRLSDKWLYKLAPVLGTRPGFLLEFAPEDAEYEALRAVLDLPAARRIEAAEILKVLKARN